MIERGASGEARRPGTAALAFPLIGAVLSLAPFVPLLIPDGRIIPSYPYCDYASYQLPVREFARDEWLAGRLGLWIPWLGCGMPLHAGQQAALCYPLLSPLVLVAGANYGIKLSLFLHLLLAWLGQYRLCRAFAISRPSATFAAVVSAQSAFVIAHLMEGHVTVVLAAALVPWFFLALVLLARRPGPITAAGIAVIAALLALAGHPQVPYYCVLFGTLWALGSLVAGRAALQRIRFLGWAGVAAVVAVLIASVQLLPTLELLRDGAPAAERGTSAYAGALALRPLDLLRFLVPDFLGNPLRGIPEFKSSAFLREKVGYLGIATPLLALYAITRGSARQWEYGAALLVLATIIIALGHSTPVFRIIGPFVPGLFLFRCPGRVFGILSVLAPLLAARGADALLQRGEPAAPRQRAAVLLAVWLAANGLAYLLLRDAATFPWKGYATFCSDRANQQFVAAAAVAAMTITALVIVARRLPHKAFFGPGLLLGVVLIDLWYSNASSFTLVREGRPRIPAPILAEDPPVRFVHAPSYPRFTPSGLRYSTMVPVAIHERRSMVGTNEGGVFPAAVERLHSAVRRDGERVLSVSACAYAGVHADRWEPIAAVPRIRFLPGAHARLAEIPIEQIRPEELPQSSFSFRVLHESPSQLLLDVDLPTAGLLVVADVYYPGWRCRVGERTHRIDPVHGVFRGVLLPEGRQQVEFRYEPLSFWRGLAGSAIGILISCGLAAFGCRQIQLERADAPARLDGMTT